MGVRYWVCVCSLFALLQVMGVQAMAQTPLPIPGTQPAAAAAQQPAAPKPAAVAPAPKIDMADITKRANQATGVDIEARMKHWQKISTPSKRLCANRGCATTSSTPIATTWST